MKKGFLSLIFCVTILCGCMSRNKAKKQFRTVETTGRTFDAAIIPGLALKTNKWGIFMKYRVIWASYLYKKGIVKNLIFSGGAVYSPYYEAYIMGEYAKKMGVPDQHIFYDTVAKHSVENVYYSYVIARQQGFKRIALCTDRFQTTFLKKFLRKHFTHCVYRMPVVKDTVDKYEFEPQIDMATALVPDSAGFRSIRKTESFRSRLNGTMGKKIPWEITPQQDCREDTIDLVVLENLN